MAIHNYVNRFLETCFFPLNNNEQLKLEYICFHHIYYAFQNNLFTFGYIPSVYVHVCVCSLQRKEQAECVRPLCSCRPVCKVCVQSAGRGNTQIQQHSHTIKGVTVNEWAVPAAALMSDLKEKTSILAAKIAARCSSPFKSKHLLIRAALLSACWASCSLSVHCSLCFWSCFDSSSVLNTLRQKDNGCFPNMLKYSFSCPVKTWS